MNWYRQMRGGTTVAERLERRMLRVSARQRVVVVTFESVAAAEAWDALEGDAALRSLRVIDLTEEETGDKEEE